MTRYRIASFVFVISLFILSNLLISRFNVPSVPVDISIDAILEKIPNCTTHDRAQQRILLKTLQAWVQFTTEHHIQYWIAYGSLVGYVQRGGLLPHDSDVDVVILAQETTKLVPFVTKNFSAEYYMLVQPLWSRPSYNNRSYVRDKGINFVAPNARFIHRASSIHVDIWAAHEIHPDRSNATAHQEEGLTEYDIDYDWMTLPRNWTFPLQKCRFSEIPVWCPAQPKKLVTRVYGVTALNTSDTSCKNGKWV